MIRKTGKWFKKQVRGTEKGKKDEAGSEEARGENVEFEKWKRVRQSQKALKNIWEKTPDSQNKRGASLRRSSG